MSQLQINILSVTYQLTPSALCAWEGQCELIVGALMASQSAPVAPAMLKLTQRLLVRLLLLVLPGCLCC